MLAKTGYLFIQIYILNYDILHRRSRFCNWLAFRCFVRELTTLLINSSFRNLILDESNFTKNLVYPYTPHSHIRSLDFYLNHILRVQIG